MAVPWGLLAFAVGVAYGYLTPGKTDKSRLYAKALLWGLILALGVAVAGWITDSNPLGIAADPLGFALGFAVSLLIFVLGVWLGDRIETRVHRTRTGGRPRIGA